MAYYQTIELSEFLLERVNVYRFISHPRPHLGGIDGFCQQTRSLFLLGVLSDRDQSTLTNIPDLPATRLNRDGSQVLLWPHKSRTGILFL